MSQNVEDIWRSHKVYQKYHSKLEGQTESGREKFNWGEIQRGIFQGDAVPLLLFAIAMMPLNHIFAKCSGVYTLHKSQEKNHMFIDDIRLCVKNEKDCKS